MASGRIHVGVGGWTFAPWRGPFYPPGLPHSRELEYAGQRLTAIEINATFYRAQKPESYVKWGEAVPDGFVFTIKASRYCVNRKRLAEGAESLTKFFAQGFTQLGPKLGPILWQFAPTKTFDAGDIEEFLRLLPAERDGVRLRHALEPRHPSFDDPAFYALARRHGVAVVSAAAEAYPCFTEQTADFAYARVQCAREDLANGYDDAALDRWAEQARAWARGGRDVFLFFISAAKVRNPAAAQALIARL